MPSNKSTKLARPDAIAALRLNGEAIHLMLGLLGILLGAHACGRSAVPPAANPTDLQAAAVAFLAQANGDRAPCVHAATGPDELTQGRVALHLQDPPVELVTLLQGQGVTVRPFSTCSLRRWKRRCKDTSSRRRP